MSKFIDLTGQRFNRLIVIERVKNKGKNVIWKCKCDCGNITFVSSGSLLNNYSKSCGCLRKEISSKKAKIHGQSNNKIYYIYKQMKNRCYNSFNKEYKNYGERGIKVCNEWNENFINFYNWAINNGYNQNAKRGECTLDRIDVNGNYCSENCRWVNEKIQQRNRRNNRLITYNNETHCLSEWAEITGINLKIIHNRLSYLNWTIEKALTTPIKRTKN